MPDPDVKIINSLKEISRNEWDACFVGEVEGYDYLLAVEDALIKGFTWRYIIVRDNVKIIAAMPMFLSDYSIDTTLEGIGKRITKAITNISPKFLTMKLACLGSPCTESGNVGFHKDTTEQQQKELLKKILVAFENYAKTCGYKLLGIKDISELQKQLWNGVIGNLKYSEMPGLPVAYLDIDFTSIDEYISRLSANTRKSMRRKIRASEQKIRIEHHNTLGDNIISVVHDLYNATRERSQMQFEELTAEYFSGVLRNMPDRSVCTLYYTGDKILAANILIYNQERIIDKFFCMRPEGREYDLYFLSWFANLRYCLDNGIKRYQSGQACYENKIKLGSKLIRNSMYFKHGNIIVNGVLKLAAPLLAVDEFSQEVSV